MFETPYAEDLDPMDAELREAIEVQRAKTETAIRDISVLRTEVDAIKTSLTEKHGQNRRDIHAIRNEMQLMADRFAAKLEQVGDKFMDFSREITETIHEMQMASAKQKGIWLAVGGMATFGLEMIKLVIEHFWK